MSTSKKRPPNTPQASKAAESTGSESEAESTGSDLSSYENKVQSLMDAFSFSRAKAEVEARRLTQTSQPTSAVDESQEIIAFYTKHSKRLYFILKWKGGGRRFLIISKI